MIYRRHNRLARRALSLLFALVMALELAGGLAPPARAVQADPTTGTISLYRWDKQTDYATRSRQSSLNEMIALLWDDGGETYIFTQTPKWEGKYTNVGYYKDDNFALSNYPYLNNLIKANCNTFFSNNTFGLVHHISSSGAPAVSIMLKEKWEDGYLQYDTYQRSLANKRYNDGMSEWIIKAQGDGITIRSEVYMHDKDTPSYSDDEILFLAHDKTTLKGMDKKPSSPPSEAKFRQPYVVKSYDNISAIQQSFTIADGMVSNLNNKATYLSPGATLTVKSGGVLSIGGALLNDGRIVVEPGGLLVLKEGAAIMPYDMTSTTGGSVTCSGNIVIRKNARLVGGGTGGLYLTAGTVDNYGAIISENFRVNQENTIENHTGAQVIAGRTLGYPAYNNLLAAVLDGISIPALSESDTTTQLDRGLVLMEQSAIYDKGGSSSIYDSFDKGGADVTGDVVRVMTRADADEDWNVGLRALKDEIGYYQSDPMYITNREYLHDIGAEEEQRSAYFAGEGAGKSEEDFQTYYAAWAAKLGFTSLDGAIGRVYDGVFTVNGEAVLTVPWYEEITVYEGNDVVVEPALVSDTKAIWGDGAKPENAPDPFEGNSYVGKIFELEPRCALGKRAEVAGGGIAAGDNVRIWDAQTNAMHHRWRFDKAYCVRRRETGMEYYFYLVNIQSGMAMTLTSTLPVDGQNVRQKAKATGHAWDQVFRVEGAGGGSVRLISRAGDDLALAVNKSADANGTNVQVNRIADDNGQKWTMVEVRETDYVGKVFELEPECAPGMRVEVVGGSTYWGYSRNVALGPNRNVAYQRFRFDLAAVVQEAGTAHAYYYLVPTHWKHVMSPSTSSVKDGTNVCQYQSGAQSYKMWRLVDNGDGTFGLVLRANQSVQLSVANISYAEGANIQVNTINNDSPGQRWKLIPVE